MEQKLYTIADLSEILKLHPKTILRFIHEGKIVARKIGRTWMVSEQELREYCHAELAEPGKAAENRRQSGDETREAAVRRITVSAVVEINEQNSEEASRISNSLMAMLNSERDSAGNSRFDFFYYPEVQKAKYVFYGTPEFIKNIMISFSRLCEEEE